MTIKRMDVVAPAHDRPYSEIPKTQNGVVLATKDGNNTLLWHVFVSKFIEDWGPDGLIRLEGYTLYNNDEWNVIAWYRLGKTDGVLGQMEVISTTSK